MTIPLHAEDALSAEIERLRSSIARLEAALRHRGELFEHRVSAGVDTYERLAVGFERPDVRVAIGAIILAADAAALADAPEDGT